MVVVVEVVVLPFAGACRVFERIDAKLPTRPEVIEINAVKIAGSVYAFQNKLAAKAHTPTNANIDSVMTTMNRIIFGVCVGMSRFLSHICRFMAS